jgi:hypothetical protein
MASIRAGGGRRRAGAGRRSTADQVGDPDRLEESIAHSSAAAGLPGWCRDRLGRLVADALHRVGAVIGLEHHGELAARSCVSGRRADRRTAVSGRRHR